MVVRFGVLGPVSAEVDGRPARLGGPRQRAVLAVLLIARGRVVSAEQIVSAVWEGLAPPSPTTLQAYVSELRKALEPGREVRAPGRLLVREGPGYALRAAPADVDAECFTDLAARGRRAMEAGEHEKAEDLLGRALELWRGPAYAEFAEAGFAVPEAARLEDLRAGVREDRLAAMIELGRPAESVGPLEVLVGEHPLRERGWELLALAQYRAGRQADALATLRAVRRSLADELGIEPGPALRSLESAMFAQDTRLDPVEAPRPRSSPPSAPPAAASGHSGNLPFSLSAFVGREPDLELTGRLLAEHRLVTLTGPGGVGKTRLSLETARLRRDADGPWLVELAGMQEPGLLPSVVAAALGIPGTATAEQLAAVLADRETLLLLDNCEHLVAPVAETVAVLLSRCGGLRVLATSREPLGLSGEAVHEVQPLDPAGDAAELFLRRASAALPGWAPDDAERAGVVALCAKLDGIPLALELAAAQCRMLSVAQISDALHDGFDVLVGGPSGPDRHRTLENTVAWSHRLLEPAERRLFHRLGVFAGPFDLEAAGAVAGVSPVLPPLAALVRKSLLAVEPGTAPRRYRMLETLRQYALRGLDPEDLAPAGRRHRAWVLARAEAAERRLRGPEAADLLAMLGEEQAEIRTAFTSAAAEGDGEYMLRLAGALYWFWYRKGHIAEGLSWLADAFALAPDADPGVRARARAGFGGLLYLEGRFQEAYETSLVAEEEARQAGDPVTEALAALYKPYMGVLAGAHLDVPALLSHAVEVAGRSGEQWLTTEALMVQGMIGRVLGDPSSADVLARAVAVGRACGHDWAMGSAVWSSMKTALDHGDGRRALALTGELLDMLERHVDVTSWLVLLHTSAHALAVAGQGGRAALLMGAVDAVGRRVGFSPEVMDPFDGPREAAAVRESLPPEKYERLLAEGRRLSRQEANALLAESSVRAGGTPDLVGGP
ncbi:AfsR/SARP family transcriptional regulator [Actinocorallia aurantiaca]|uniref:AfsR/SARP family transcriptional regulator n=1 Tax=Actinocorallia aurantiaca TaxID=46204 RepID=UPI0031D6DF36